MALADLFKRKLYNGQESGLQPPLKFWLHCQMGKFELENDFDKFTQFWTRLLKPADAHLEHFYVDLVKDYLTIGHGRVPEETFRLDNLNEQWFKRVFGNPFNRFRPHLRLRYKGTAMDRWDPHFDEYNLVKLHINGSDSVAYWRLPLNYENKDFLAGPKYDWNCFGQNQREETFRNALECLLPNHWAYSCTWRIRDTLSTGTLVLSGEGPSEELWTAVRTNMAKKRPIVIDFQVRGIGKTRRYLGGNSCVIIPGSIKEQSFPAGMPDMWTEAMVTQHIHPLRTKAIKVWTNVDDWAQGKESNAGTMEMFDDLSPKTVLPIFNYDRVSVARENFCCLKIWDWDTGKFTWLMCPNRLSFFKAAVMRVWDDYDPRKGDYFAVVHPRKGRVFVVGPETTQQQWHFQFHELLDDFNVAIVRIGEGTRYSEAHIFGPLWVTQSCATHKPSLTASCLESKPSLTASYLERTAPPNLSDLIDEFRWDNFINAVNGIPDRLMCYKGEPPAESGDAYNEYYSREATPQPPSTKTLEGIHDAAQPEIVETTVTTTIADECRELLSSAEAEAEVDSVLEQLPRDTSGDADHVAVPNDDGTYRHPSSSLSSASSDSVGIPYEQLLPAKVAKTPGTSVDDDSSEDREIQEAVEFLKEWKGHDASEASDVEAQPTSQTTVEETTTTDEEPSQRPETDPSTPQNRHPSLACLASSDSVRVHGEQPSPARVAKAVDMSIEYDSSRDQDIQEAVEFLKKWKDHDASESNTVVSQTTSQTTVEETATTGEELSRRPETDPSTLQNPPKIPTIIIDPAETPAPPNVQHTPGHGLTPYDSCPVCALDLRRFTPAVKNRHFYRHKREAEMWHRLFQMAIEAISGNGKGKEKEKERGCYKCPFTGCDREFVKETRWVDRVCHMGGHLDRGDVFADVRKAVQEIADPGTTCISCGHHFPAGSIPEDHVKHLQEHITADQGFSGNSSVEDDFWTAMNRPVSQLRPAAFFGHIASPTGPGPAAPFGHIDSPRPGPVGPFSHLEQLIHEHGRGDQQVLDVFEEETSIRIPVASESPIYFVPEANPSSLVPLFSPRGIWRPIQGFVEEGSVSSEGATPSPRQTTDKSPQQTPDKSANATSRKRKRDDEVYRDHPDNISEDEEPDLDLAEEFDDEDPNTVPAYVRKRYPGKDLYCPKCLNLVTGKSKAMCKKHRVAPCKVKGHNNWLPLTKKEVLAKRAERRKGKKRLTAAVKAAISTPDLPDYESPKINPPAPTTQRAKSAMKLSKSPIRQLRKRPSALDAPYKPTDSDDDDDADDDLTPATPRSSLAAAPRSKKRKTARDDDATYRPETPSSSGASEELTPTLATTPSPVAAASKSKKRKTRHDEAAYRPETPPEDIEEVDAPGVGTHPMFDSPMFVPKSPPFVPTAGPLYSPQRPPAAAAAAAAQQQPTPRPSPPPTVFASSSASTASAPEAVRKTAARGQKRKRKAPPPPLDEPLAECRLFAPPVDVKVEGEGEGEGASPSYEAPPHSDGGVSSPLTAPPRNTAEMSPQTQRAAKRVRFAVSDEDRMDPSPGEMRRWGR